MKITDAEIDELAKLPKESAANLEVRLGELRSRGAGILQCIKYVRLNQACSLKCASDIVINSRVWADLKDDYLREQQEYFEEFLAEHKDRIERIAQTYTEDGAETTVHMRPPE